jgi:hypothetical protein
MLADAFSQARAGQTRTEIGRLRTEIAFWHAHRTKNDKHQQYVTTLQLLQNLFSTALDEIDLAARKLETLSEFALWSEARRLDRALVWVRRVWEYFRRRFDQRDQPSMQPLLAAADEVVWGCYVEPFRALGLKHQAAPLPYIEDRFSPQTLPRLDPPPDLQSDVDAAFLNRYLSELPVAVIGLPPTSLEHPWWLVYLAHEVGHQVQYDLVSDPKWGLVGAFGQFLAETAAQAGDAAAGPRWTAWGRELFADVYSVLMVGPAAIWSILELEYADVAGLLRSKSNYPAPAIRLSVMAGMLRKLDVVTDPYLRGLDLNALAAGDPITELKRDLRAEAMRDLKIVRALVARLATEPLVTDKTLPQLCGWSTTSFAANGTVSGWSEKLVKKDPPYPDTDVAAARLSTAGAVLAWTKICEEAAAGPGTDEVIAARRENARKHLKQMTLATVPRCREEGTREAQASPTAADAVQRGRELASLVLEAGR